MYSWWKWVYKWLQRCVIVNCNRIQLMHTGYIKPRWSDCYVSFTSFSHASDYINTERNNHNFKSSKADRCKVNTLQMRGNVVKNTTFFIKDVLYSKKWNYMFRPLLAIFRFPQYFKKSLQNWVRAYWWERSPCINPLIISSANVMCKQWESCIQWEVWRCRYSSWGCISSCGRVWR